MKHSFLVNWQTNYRKLHKMLYKPHIFVRSKFVFAEPKCLPLVIWVNGPVARN